jgi:hypothetical protein
MSNPNYRAELQDLYTSIQLYTGQNPAAADVHPAELTRRLMDAMAASAAALAQPEPVAPTLVYRYSPVTVAECGGPCEQGPQYCDCGEIKGEPAPEPVAPTDEGSVPLSPLVVTDSQTSSNLALWVRLAKSLDLLASAAAEHEVFSARLDDLAALAVWACDDRDYRDALEVQP